MKKTKHKSGTIVLKERLDFINVLGDSSHINHSSELGFQKLKDYFCNTHGFSYERANRDVNFHSPKGVRKIIVNFTRNRQNGSPIIKVKFPGSFLYGCQRSREAEIRNFITTVWEDLSIDSLPYTNEFDIAVDTLGATFKKHGIDLNSPKWKLINKRSRKFKYQVHPHHNNAEDHCEKTGQTVLGTRFKFRTYDRIMALEQRYKKDDYIHYRAYYYELYESFNRVMREEVKLKKELCDLFNILFWGGKKSLEKTLPHCLALFIRNHKFISTKTGEPNKRIENNFYIDEQMLLKEAQKDLGFEGTSLKTLKHNAPKYNKEILFKKLALAHLAERGSFLKSMEQLMDYAKENIEFYIDEHITNLTKSYQTNLLLAQSDKEKRDKIISDYHLEKFKLIQTKKIIQEEFRAKRSKS